MVKRNMGAFEDLSQDMERMFDSFLGRTFGSVLRAGDERHIPAADMFETAEHYEVVVDLPGVAPEQVSVELQEGELVVSGLRKNSVDQSANVHRSERYSGGFRRSVPIPGEVDLEHVDASFSLGVLHVKLPKMAKQHPTKIQIRTEGK